MKKLIWFTVFTVLFLVFVLPGILALAVDMIPFNDQPGYSIEEKTSVYGKGVISQKFTSQESNLTAIGISLGNPNLKNKKTIILSLYERENVIRTSAISGLNLEDGDFVKFVFPVLTDSKGRSYSFTITSPLAGQEEVVYTFRAREVPSWIGELRFNDGEREDKLPGALPFVTFHKPINKWQIVKEVYSSWLSRLLPLGSRKT